MRAATLFASQTPTAPTRSGDGRCDPDRSRRDRQPHAAGERPQVTAETPASEVRCSACRTGRTGTHDAGCTVEDRFWRKVRVTDGCWEWVGSLNNQGYGQLRVGRGHGVLVLAHRMSMQFVCGPVARTILACHRCDNPLCVRPDHLFPGTHADNARDAVVKGRVYRRLDVDRCKHGHQYGDDAPRTSEGWRVCSICLAANRDRKRARRAALRAQLTDAAAALNDRPQLVRA